MNLKDLEILAHEAVSMPYGCGDKILAKDPDSSVPYQRFLHNAIQHYSVLSIVELGVYRGICTAHMALANPNAIIVGVDISPHSSCYNNIKRFSNIILVVGDSIESYHEVGLLAKPIGLLFIDATHDGSTPLAEFEIYKPFFADVCLVACDDIELNTEMQTFWEQLPGEKMKLNFLHPPYNDDYPLSGFGVSIVRSNA